MEWFHAAENKRSEPQLIAVITILSKIERFSGNAESTLCANRPSADDHQAIGFERAPLDRVEPRTTIRKDVY